MSIVDHDRDIKSSLVMVVRGRTAHDPDDQNAIPKGDNLTYVLSREQSHF
jgi:hypothetical protein